MCGRGGPRLVAWTAGGGGECLPGGDGALLCLSHYDFAVVCEVWVGIGTAWVRDVHAIEYRRGADAVDGGRFVESFRQPEGGAGGDGALLCLSHYDFAVVCEVWVGIGTAWVRDVHAIEYRRGGHAAGGGGRA